MPNPDYKALCAELVVIEDAMSGGSVQLSSQGQALDGYAALAAFRYIAAKARIALAQPEPVAPTDEDLMAAARKAIDTYPRGSELPYFLHEDSSEYEPMLLALRSAARWGTLAIEPVSVSESLPEPEDCDEEGRCWVFDDMLGLPSWTLIKVLGKNLEPDMTWLPHHALPVPAPANNTRGTH